MSEQARQYLAGQIQTTVRRNLEQFTLKAPNSKESVFDSALKDINIDFDRSSADYQLLGIDVNSIQTDFINFRRKFFRKASQEESLPKQLAMLDSLCLLGALADPIANKINAGRVVNIASVRNLSVYAHGIRPMTNQSVDEMRKLAKEALEVYAATREFDNIENERSRFEFMSLAVKKN